MLSVSVVLHYPRRVHRELPRLCARRALMWRRTCHSSSVTGQCVHDSRPLLQNLMIATRTLEQDSSTIFDTIATLPSAFQVASGDALFPDIFARNVYSPTLVAACALCPSFAPETLTPPARLMILHAVRSCIFNIDPAFKEKQLENEIKILLDGSVQRLFRMKPAADRNPRKRWHSGDTPLLAHLFEYLEQTPSSSADVERCFAAHARVHTKSRNGLAEESVEAQLGLHSFLAKASSAGTDPVVALASQQDLDTMIGWCVQSWCSERSNLITEGDSIMAWYEIGKTGRLHGCQCIVLQHFVVTLL